MEAAVAEFAFVEALPPAKQVDESGLSKSERLHRKLTVIKDLMASKGVLVPVALVAEVFGLSRQRIHGICDQGHMEKVVIHGTSYITEESLLQYLKEERKAGRPRKPISALDLAKASMRFAQSA